MRTFEARFEANVERTPGCWIWMGSRRSPDPALAYGMFWLDGKIRPAAQVAWEIANGRPFPESMDACHTCDNPPCVNPAHVFPGTAQDNARDAYAKGRLYPVPPPSRPTH